jgi:signal transduction histidine kinase
LDDLGLVPALNALAASYTHSGLSVTVLTAEPFPILPAAYEVAIYRIAQEALTNVARHAQARHCFVRLRFETDLSLEIEDDGVGVPPNRTSGVGLNSMRERGRSWAEPVSFTGCLITGHRSR